MQWIGEPGAFAVSDFGTDQHPRCLTQAHLRVALIDTRDNLTQTKKLADRPHRRVRRRVHVRERCGLPFPCVQVNARFCSGAARACALRRLVAAVVASRCNGYAIRYRSRKNKGFHAAFLLRPEIHATELPPRRPDFIDPRLSPVNPLATRLAQMMSGGPKGPRTSIGTPAASTLAAGVLFVRSTAIALPDSLVRSHASPLPETNRQQ